MNLNNKKVKIINCDINPISLKLLCEKITECIKEKKGHYICILPKKTHFMETHLRAQKAFLIKFFLDSSSRPKYFISEVFCAENALQKGDKLY